MADAVSKILDAWKSAIEAWPALSGEPIRIDLPSDEALDGDTDMPCTVVFVEDWKFDAAFYQGQTAHEIVVNFERLESSENVGVISRANREVLSEIIKVIHANRTLGGRLEEVQERDIAAPGSEMRRGFGGASLQTIQRFNTPRGDHDTIVGQGGTTF